MDEKVMAHLGDAPAKKKKKTHVHKVEIERGHKGGFVATHHHRDEEGNHSHTTGPHVLANHDMMHDSVDEAMGDQPNAEEGAPEAAGQQGEDEEPQG